MKTITSIFLFLVFSLGAADGSILSDGPGLFTEGDEQELQAVNVYYFHMTRRCTTCQAVEDVTKSILGELYPEMMESGQITFQSLDLEDESTDMLAEKNNISGQTLVFISGDQVVDMTADGFMYACTNPDKLKEKIRKTVDGFLK